MKVSTMLKDIKTIIQTSRHNVYTKINTEMLKVYFEIGRRIVEEEQYGKKRAKYGEKLIDFLSKELQKEFTKGFDVTNLRRIRRFYLIYQKWETLSPKLSWSHYSELIKIDDENKRKYFEKYIISENLSVRDLKRQIYSLHYERLLLSKDKQGLIKFENKLLKPTKTEELIKDPYILEFLNLDESKKYTEKEFETKILDNIQKFLLELGQGFSFVARQKRFTIDNEHYYIDLLFYNIYLKSYFVIESKTNKFKHEDVGQINFYLNYVKNELNKKEDNEPIGLILCTDKNNIQVEYATTGLTNKLFVSKYKLYLPNKKELENKLREIM